MIVKFKTTSILSTWFILSFLASACTHQAAIAQESIVARIQSSGISIYDQLEPKSDLYLSNKQLETTLNKSFHGLDLDFKIRTRAKVARQAVCQALGYPTPESFKKTQPRFPGQNFDVYVQKSNNLQIWNEAIDANRRYVIIRLNEKSIVSKVKVLSGIHLARLDSTGTLTQKYQAKAKMPFTDSALLTKTESFDLSKIKNQLPGLQPIEQVYQKLLSLKGERFKDPGDDQERNRGEAIHRMVCQQLNSKFNEDGQFPDVTDQLLEIKLQTSPTIDLGLISPGSTRPNNRFPNLRYCDTRYAIFYAETDGKVLTIQHVVLINGQDFFHHFDRFAGKVANKKLQIFLPEKLFK